MTSDFDAEVEKTIATAKAVVAESEALMERANAAIAEKQALYERAGVTEEMVNRFVADLSDEDRAKAEAAQEEYYNDLQRDIEEAVARAQPRKQDGPDKPGKAAKPRMRNMA